MGVFFGPKALHSDIELGYIILLNIHRLLGRYSNSSKWCPVVCPWCHISHHESRQGNKVCRHVNSKPSERNSRTTGERTDACNYKYAAGELNGINLVFLCAKADFNFKLFLARSWKGGFRLLTLQGKKLDRLQMHAYSLPRAVMTDFFHPNRGRRVFSGVFPHGNQTFEAAVLISKEQLGRKDLPTLINFINDLKQKRRSVAFCMLTGRRCWHARRRFTSSLCAPGASQTCRGEIRAKKALTSEWIGHLNAWWGFE